MIDRLWPRGIRKADAAIDQWVKDIAPSTALRKWFGHDPVRWAEFRAGTLRRSTSIPNSSADYGPWQDKVRSRSCSRLTTRSITTRLRYGSFFWDERQRERPRRIIGSVLEETKPMTDSVEDRTAAPRSHRVNFERGGRPYRHERVAAAAAGDRSPHPDRPALDQHLVGATDRSRALVLVIALAQSLRELPGVQAFIKDYPGIAQSAPSVNSGFPWWLQLQHFLNMLFMMFIIRAGIQILADHPRLYWTRDCTPGTEWFRFQYPVPEGRIWTSKDNSVTLPGWLGIPGVRHSIGLARWWHFSIVMLWTINGIAFYVLIFTTGQWLRLVPVTWGVFPAALSTALQYASLNFPVDESWTRYNGLQQLSYFITVFVAAPVSILPASCKARRSPIGWACSGPC